MTTLFKRFSSNRAPDFDPAKRKTHKNNAVIKILKELPLDRRLELNREIEEKNKKKRERKLRIAMGRELVQLDDALSSTASLITISDQSYEAIRKTPELYEKVKGLLSFRVLEYMTKKNAEEKAVRVGNGTGDESGEDHVYAPEVTPVERDSANLAEIIFPRELYLVANHGYIPLGLFHSSRIRLLEHVAPGLSTRTVYPTNGNKMQIWDTNQLIKHFGFKDDDFEGCPTFVEFTDAMMNYSAFVCEWDKKKEDGNHSQFIFQHAAFWCKNYEIVDIYEHWKKAEKDFRMDWRLRVYKFDINEYRSKLQECKMRAEMKKLAPAPPSFFPNPFNSFRGRGRWYFLSLTARSARHDDFPLLSITSCSF